MQQNSKIETPHFCRVLTGCHCQR